MTPYSQITKYVREEFGLSIQQIWIADVKRAHGLLTTRPMPDAVRRQKCPPERRAAIEAAMRHFGMLPNDVAAVPSRTPPAAQPEP